MKHFIVSEEGLREIREFYGGENLNRIFAKLKPVTEIASGTLKDLFVIPAVHKYEIYFTSNTSYKIGTIPDMKGKPIKIFIEEE